jgi:hypothetical protein
MLAQRGVGFEVGRGHRIVAALGTDLVAAIAEIAAQDFSGFQSRRARVLKLARELSARGLRLGACAPCVIARVFFFI